MKCENCEVELKSPPITLIVRTTGQHAFVRYFCRQRCHLDWMIKTARKDGFPV